MGYDTVISDARKHIAQVGFGIDVVQLCGADQAVDGHDVFVGLDSPIVHVAQERSHPRSKYYLICWSTVSMARR